MDLLAQFALLGDAAQLALLGGLCWVIAAFAGMMERRRARRRDVSRLDAVGWVPWTALFMTAAIIGGGCLAMGLPVVIAE